MDLSHLDPEVREVVARAYASFREKTTMCPDWADRQPFVGPGRNKTPEPINKELTIDSAFTLLIKAKGILSRNETAASAKEVLNIWLDYKHQYVEHPDHPLPAEELAGLGLSVLTLRDVFCDVQKYMLKGRYPQMQPSARKSGRLQSIADIVKDATSKVAPTPSGNPYVPLLQTARRQAKRVTSAEYDFKKACHHLQNAGYIIKRASIDQLREMQSIAQQHEMYPRTYL